MPQTAGYPKAITKAVSKSILQEVADAKSKLKHGQMYRRNKREALWKQSELQYEGNHWAIGGNANEDPDNDQIVVNMSFCVDPLTEILTQRGWLDFDELVVGDIALTYNLEKGYSEWQPISDINVFEGKYTMLSMESRSHSSMSTANHRWPSVTSWGKRRMVTSETLGSHDRIPVTAPRNGDEFPAVELYPTALVELVAWFWTEGHIPMSGTLNRVRGRALNITQSHKVNFEHVESIRLAFKELWGAPTEGRLRPGVGPLWAERQNGDNTRFWTNADAGDLIQVLAPNKTPSREFILSLTPTQLERFINVSMDGDGSDGRTMVQASLPRAEAFQFALMQAGIASSLRRTAPPRRPEHNQAYSVSLRKHSFHTPGQTRQGMAWVDYEGKVWCPTTPNGTFMARRNGFTYFTGNSTVNTIVPYMTGSDPDFILTPGSGDASMRNAAVQAAFLNRLWRSHEVRAQDQLEIEAVDYLVYGDGYGKVGYDIEERRTSENTYDDVALVWMQRVNPWDVWIDPTSDGVHDARWVCQRLRLTKQELEDNAKYRNVDDENVTYGSREHFDEEASDMERFRTEVMDGSEYATIFEFYDMVHSRKIVFADGDRPLQYVEDIGACPIVQMGNYRIPRSPYHMGELEQLWSLQAELNYTRSHMITHRRRNAQKFAYREGELTEDALAALRSNAVNAAVAVKGDRPLADILQPLQVPNLSGDVYNVSQIMQADIYEISGVNEYLRGGTPEIRRTATEASIIEGASNIKSQFKLRAVEKAAREMGRLMLAFAKDIFPQTNYDEMTMYLTGREAERVAKADGHELAPGESVQISPHPDIFVGDYIVEVTQSSTELRNPIMREQKYKSIFQDMVGAAAVLSQFGVIPNFKRMMELWFEAAGVDDIDSMFVQPEAPAALPGEDPAALGVEPAGVGGLPGVPPGLPPELAGFIDSENSGILPPEAG